MKKLRTVLQTIVDNLDLDELMDIGGQFATILWLITASGLLAAGVFHVIANGGVDVLIARQLANTCQTTGVCDFQALYGGFGMVIVILSSFVLILGISFRLRSDRAMTRGDMTDYLDEMRGLIERDLMDSVDPRYWAANGEEPALESE
jgi:uncharacterized membrane protein YidH (DUF202 family)